MNSCEITTFITAIANVVAKDRSASEVAILAAVFVQFADTLATLAVLKQEEEEWNNLHDFIKFSIKVKGAYMLIPRL